MVSTFGRCGPRGTARAGVCVIALVAGCASPSASESPAFADRVIAAPGATGEGYADPSRAVNGVRGGGVAQGSLDVYSLNYTDRPYITLGFEGRAIVDGDGAELVVFENAFRVNASDTYFMDPIVVSVSRDGETFRELPHRYLADDPTTYVVSPDAWEGFAGTLPTLLHVETNPVDPFDPIRAGGNAFDLAELGDDEEATALRFEGVRYVRLTSAAVVLDPTTGHTYPHDRVSDGADVDGVAARYLVADPGASSSAP